MSPTARSKASLAVVCLSALSFVPPTGAPAEEGLREDFRQLLAARRRLVAQLAQREQVAGPMREYRLLLAGAADRDDLELTLRRRGEAWGECFAESLAWCQGTMQEWRGFHLGNRAGCAWRSTLPFPAGAAGLSAGDRLAGELSVAFRLDETLDEKLPPGEPFGWWDRFIPTGFSQPRKQTFRLDAAVRDDAWLLELVLADGVTWPGKARDGGEGPTRRPITVRLLVPSGRFTPATARTPTWNGGFHEADATGLRMAAGRLAGRLVVYLHQDGWLPFGTKPPQHEPVDVTFELDARLDHNVLRGTYAARMGGTYQGQAYRGGVVETVIPETKWTGVVLGRGGKAVLGRYEADGDVGPRAGGVCGMLLDDAAAAEKQLPPLADVPADGPAAVKHVAKHIDPLLHEIRAAHLALQQDIDLVEALAQTAVAGPAWADDANAAALLAAYCRRARQLVDAAGSPDAPLPKPLAEGPADTPSTGVAAVPADANGLHFLPAGEAWCFLPRWHVLGPFEQRPGLEHDAARVAEVVPVPGLSYRQPLDRFGTPRTEGPAARWQAVTCTGPRLAPPWEKSGFFVRFAGEVWYALGRVRSDKARPVCLAVESADHAKLWLNGRLVWTGREMPWRYRDRGREIVPATLAAGDNELLLRVHHDRRLSWVRLGLRAGEPTQAAASAAAEAPAAAPGRPDAAPPLAWDIEKGLNVAWRRSDLAGNSGPLAVGDALFVAAAPHALHCLDLATGKARWTAEANVLELGDAGAPAAWKADDEAGRIKLLAAAGLRLRKLSDVPTARPVGDGRRTWGHWGTGVAACFDADGTRRWMVRTHLSAAELHRHEDVLIVEGKPTIAWELPADRAASGKSRRPAVIGVLLLDAASGETRARWTLFGEFQRHAGRVLRCGRGDDEAAVFFTSTGDLIDLRTARLIGRMDIEPPGPADADYRRGVQIIGSKPGRPFGVTVAGDVLFLTSQEQSLAARFWPVGGGRLGYGHLWESNYEHGGFGSFQAPCAATGRHVFSWMPVLDRGPHCPDPRIELHVQDARTGRVRRVLKPALRSAVQHEVVPALAGGYVFCTDRGGGTHGGLSGHGQMVVATADADLRVVCRNLVDLGTRGPPVFAGGRMLLRSDQALTCIAVAGPEGVRYQQRRLAATLLEEIGPMLDVPTPLEVEPAGRSVAEQGAPLGELLDGRTTEHWLAAGPMSASPEDAVLAALRPRPGDPVDGGQGAAFRPVPRRQAYTEPPVYRRQANLQGTGDIVPFFSTWVDPNCCCDGKGGGLLYAVLDNPRDRYVVPLLKGPGLAAWLAGRKLPLAAETPPLLHLRPGLYPLLVRVGPEHYTSPAPELPPIPGLIAARRELRLNPAFRDVPHPPTRQRNRLDRIRRFAGPLRAVPRDLPGTPEAAAAERLLAEIAGTSR